MKEALLKKRYGIPATLLILLVLAGVVTAFVVQTFTYSVTTVEPLSFENNDGLDLEYQGESENIIVEVKNESNNQGYGIFVDATVEGACTITYGPDAKLISTEQDEGIEDANGDDDEWDAWYNIAAGGEYNIVVTVDSVDNAAPGDLEVKLEFDRRTTYE